MNEEEELYRLMNEEDDFYMGEIDEKAEREASSEKVNNTGCLGMFFSIGILIMGTPIR